MICIFNEYSSAGGQISRREKLRITQKQKEFSQAGEFEKPEPLLLHLDARLYRKQGRTLTVEKRNSPFTWGFSGNETNKNQASVACRQPGSWVPWNGFSEGGLHTYSVPGLCTALGHRDKFGLPTAIEGLPGTRQRNREVQLCLSRAALFIKGLMCLRKDRTICPGTTYTLGRHFLRPTLPPSYTIQAQVLTSSLKSQSSLHIHVFTLQKLMDKSFPGRGPFFSSRRVPK